MIQPFTLLNLARKKFRAMKKSHPDIERVVREKIENFDTTPYAETGDSPLDHLLTHTADTNNLDLELWSMGRAYKSPNGNYFKLGPASPFREDTKTKLPVDIRNDIQGAYESLNAYTIRCLPEEHRRDSERAVKRNPNTGMTLTPHDFRFAGDTSGLMVIGRAKNFGMQLLRDVFQDAVNFIPYIFPTKTNQSVVNVLNKVTIEGKLLTTDIKGNKVVAIDTTKEKGVL